MTNQNLLIEDLKRIGFMMNYESGKLVTENLEKNKNIVIENKIENLFLPKKSNEVISEAKLREIFKEQWQLKKEEKIKIIAEQWARDKDPIGYWKILYEQLKKGGVPVKLEVANDPAKSNYMYWGRWIVWRDINKNNGWPVTLSAPEKGKPGFFFKFSGGKYAGQNPGSIKLDSKQINSTFELTQWGKVENDSAYNQFAKLTQTKPKAQGNVLPCKTVDGKPIPDNQIQSTANSIFKDIAYAFDGAGTYESNAVEAYARITCKPLLDKVNAQVAARGMSGIKNVQDWLKDEMSDYDYEQYRAIWASLQKVDKSIVAPKVDNLYRAAGYVGKYATPLGAIEALGEGAKKAYDKLMNMSTEDIMEGFREIVSGVAGTVGTLILSLIPGGQAVNVLIYGVLTAWDVIQLSNGSSKFSWFNLILDVFALALSGIGLAKALKPAEAIKPAVAEAKTLPSLFQALETKFPKIYKLLKGFVDTVGKGAKFVVDGIEKGIAWLVQKIPFLAKVGNMLRGALQKISGLIGQIVAAAEKTVVGNVVKTGAQTLGQKSAQLLAKGTAYMATKGSLIGAQVVKGLESKIGAAVAQELDKTILKKIETYAFDNGTKKLSELRPGICAMGKNYCNTFDISMNALNVAKDVKDVVKTGSGAVTAKNDLSAAKGVLDKTQKAVELGKAGTETIQKGAEGKVAKSLETKPLTPNTVPAPTVPALNTAIA